MFGISASEFIVLLAVAAVVLGPERLPEYTQSLARLVRELRRMARGASDQVRAELGPEFDDVDWRKLDPRQYDPRRIVREALADTFDPDDPLGLKEQPQGSAGAARSRAPQPDASRSDTGRPQVSRSSDGSPVVGSGDETAPRFDPDAT